MKSILKGRRLILGSKSPRRSQLLKEMDIPFVKKVADTDESYPADTPVDKVAEFIAIAKAEALMDRLKGDDLILTADTVVICEGKIFGKPKTKKEASDFLSVLSNNVHLVISGVCIKDSENMLTFSETAEVKLSSMTEDEIEYYIDKYMPFDKAGAYGIQEWIGHTKIEWIKGTYTNIMGLPTLKTYEALVSFINK